MIKSPRSHQNKAASRTTKTPAKGATKVSTRTVKGAAKPVKGKQPETPAKGVKAVKPSRPALPAKVDFVPHKKENMKEITMVINGMKETLVVDVTRSLLSIIRYELGITGPKEGCGEGECGACTVLMDGKPVTSCMVLAGEADGHEITTVEGLAEKGRLSLLQEAFIEKGALQCGFCTPGMLVTLTALLRENPDPTDDEIKTAIGGNLCRCTGYVQIIQAVKLAIAREKEGGAN